MKKIIVAIALASCFINVVGKEKCKVIITADEGVKPFELVVSSAVSDPASAPVGQRTKLENGIFECDLECDEIEKFRVVDFGQVMEQGYTSRTASFYVEDGAVIRVNLGEKGFSVSSTGREFQEWQKLDSLRDEVFADEMTQLMAKGDAVTQAEMDDFNSRYNDWMIQYCADHALLGFLFDVQSDLYSFRFNDAIIGRKLDVYHSKYENLYPEHSVHADIARHEATGYQIMGRKFNDFNVRNLDGEVVKASDFYNDRVTLVVAWATWCVPCRKGAVEAIPFFEQYKDKGLNVFSVAHEFDNANDFRAAVDQDKYPWPSLYDLNDEFDVFKKLGTASGAMFLLDKSGTIVATAFSVDDLQPYISALLD